MPSELQSMLSFDQQSKSRPNYHVARRLLEVRGGRPARILDYGSGWGSFLLKWSSKDADLFCYDISRSAMGALVDAAGLVRRKIREVEVDLHGRIDPTGFDLILCSHVLEHVPSDQFLMQRLVEALNRGGYVMANVPVNEVWTDPKHVRRYTQSSAIRLFEACGLEIQYTQEHDRWSAFLMEHEQRRERRGLSRLALRGLRAALATLPFAVGDYAERLLLSHYPPQQFLCVGCKC
jgi:2-polyprenyl-3-methyl-5-hydroxy-6-metoxy-1,4-benzoquinol methylase